MNKVHIRTETINTGILLEVLDRSIETVEPQYQNWDSMVMSYQTRSDLIEGKQDKDTVWYAKVVEGNAEFFLKYKGFDLQIKCSEWCPEDLLMFTGKDSDIIAVTGFKNGWTDGR